MRNTYDESWPWSLLAYGGTVLQSGSPTVLMLLLVDFKTKALFHLVFILLLPLSIFFFLLPSLRFLQFSCFSSIVEVAPLGRQHF